MGSVNGLVVLPQELATLPLRQALENDLRVIRILRLDRLGGHDPRLRSCRLPPPDGGLATSERLAGAVLPARRPGDQAQESSRRWRRSGGPMSHHPAADIDGLV